MPYSSFNLRNPDLFIGTPSDQLIEIVAPIPGNDILLSRTLTVRQFRNSNLLEMVLLDLRRERDTREKALGIQKSSRNPVG